ncbi:MAG: AraC family transcriptional regulator [bacterium]
MRWKTYVRDGSAFHASRSEAAFLRRRVAHDHADFSEVFFVEAGEVDHWLNGQRVRLGAGALVFLRAADCHGFQSVADRPNAMINVAFPNAIVQQLRRRYPAEAAVCFPELAQPAGCVRLHAGARDAVARLFASIRLAERTTLELDWFLLGLMREFWQARRTASPTGQPLPDWLERARMLLARPENRRRGTRHFAALAGHSPEHVAREVRRHLQTTPTDLVNRARLDHAALRLVTTQEKIISLAFDAGFANLGHFYRQFRQRYHLTPRAYRLRHTATLPMGRGR